MKVGRIAMCHNELAIYPEIDDRGFILLHVNFDRVLDGINGISGCWKARVNKCLILSGRLN